MTMKGKKKRKRKRKKLDFVWSSSKFNKDKRKPTHDKNPNPHCSSDISQQPNKHIRKQNGKHKIRNKEKCTLSKMEAQFRRKQPEGALIELTDLEWMDIDLNFHVG